MNTSQTELPLPSFSNTTDLAGQKTLIAPVFAAFRSAGFSVAHWCHDWTGEPVFYGADFAQQVRQLADHNGIRVADVHGYGGPPQGVTYTDELFAAMNINRAEFVARLGGSIVVLHLPGRRIDSPTEAIERAIALLRKIRPAFDALGVRAAVENLRWPCHTDEFFTSLFAEFAPSFLGFCYDSGHAVITNQTHLLGLHADRLIATHLHDNDGSTDQHRLPGEGRANWPEIIRILKQSRYQGTVNLELHLPKEADLGVFCRQAHETLAGLWQAT